MKIKYIIAHEIIKEQDSKKDEHERILTDYLIDIKDGDNEVIETLHNKYSKNSMEYYNFGEESNFQKYFKNYLNNQVENNFIQFTKDATISLYEKIKENNKSRGGILIFIDCLSTQHYIYIFLLRKKEFSDLQLGNNSTFQFSKIRHVNFEDMAMACRINIDEVKNTSGKRCISFISKRNDEVSNYFKNWISIDNSESNSKLDSDILLKILSKINVNSLSCSTKYVNNDELLKSAHECIKANKKKVNLKMLSMSLFDDENIIIDYANNEGLDINTEFKIDNEIYKQFIIVEVSDKFGNSLRFTKGNENDMIIISDDKKRIIINSEELAEKLLEKLNNYGNKE